MSDQTPEVVTAGPNPQTVPGMPPLPSGYTWVVLPPDHVLIPKSTLGNLVSHSQKITVSQPVKIEDEPVRLTVLRRCHLGDIGVTVEPGDEVEWIPGKQVRIQGHPHDRLVSFNNIWKYQDSNSRSYDPKSSPFFEVQNPEVLEHYQKPRERRFARPSSGDAAIKPYSDAKVPRAIDARTTPQPQDLDAEYEPSRRTRTADDFRNPEDSAYEDDYPTTEDADYEPATDRRNAVAEALRRDLKKQENRMATGDENFKGAQDFKVRRTDTGSRATRPVGGPPANELGREDAARAYGRPSRFGI